MRVTLFLMGAGLAAVALGVLVGIGWQRTWQRRTAVVVLVVLLASFVVARVDRGRDCDARGGVLVSGGHCVQPVDD